MNPAMQRRLKFQEKPPEDIRISEPL
jgi:hypothetical protein